MHNIHVFDIDSTIANNDHRAALLEKTCVVCLGDKPHRLHGPCTTCGMITNSSYSQSSWDSFVAEEMVYADSVIEKALQYATKLRTYGEPVHFITGRGDDSRKATEQWLTDKFNWNRDQEQLYTRSLADEGTPASVYKEKQLTLLCNSLNVSSSDTLFYFYEDDAHVIRMYQKYGIVVQCPQAWDYLMPDVVVSQEMSWEIPQRSVK